MPNSPFKSLSFPCGTAALQEISVTQETLVWMSEMYDDQNNQSIEQIKQQIHATVIIPQEEYWGKVTGQELFIESTSV